MKLIGQINKSYIEAKKRTAARSLNPRKLVNDPKLPPGQHLVPKMVAMPSIIYQHPEISKDQWQLKVDGEIKNPLTWNWQSFSQLPQKEFKIDFHCVTSWSKLSQKFTGVDFQEIIDRVEPTEKAKYVIFEGADGGYTTNISYQELLDNQAFVALKMDGMEIEPKYGGPARMVVPHLYGWKSCKFLIGIRFAETDQPGFWEVRGYNNHADPWKEERYS